MQDSEIKVIEAHFNLVTHLIKSCFSKVEFSPNKIPLFKDRRIVVIEGKIKKLRYRQKFADSKMLKMFCDCSYNFEFNSLSKKIKADSRYEIYLLMKTLHEIHK